MFTAQFPEPGPVTRRCPEAFLSASTHRPTTNPIFVELAFNEKNPASRRVAMLLPLRHATSAYSVL